MTLKSSSQQQESDEQPLSLSASGKIWQLIEPMERHIQHLSQTLDISPLLARILGVRLPEREQISSFLNPSLKNDLPDQFFKAKLMMMTPRSRPSVKDRVLRL